MFGLLLGCPSCLHWLTQTEQLLHESGMERAREPCCCPCCCGWHMPVTQVTLAITGASDLTPCVASLACSRRCVEPTVCAECWMVPMTVDWLRECASKRVLELDWFVAHPCITQIEGCWQRACNQCVFMSSKTLKMLTTQLCRRETTGRACDGGF